MPLLGIPYAQLPLENLVAIMSRHPFCPDVPGQALQKLSGPCPTLNARWSGPLLCARASRDGARGCRPAPLHLPPLALSRTSHLTLGLTLRKNSISHLLPHPRRGAENMGEAMGGYKSPTLQTGLCDLGQVN